MNTQVQTLKDEKGFEIPVNRINKLDLMKHKTATKAAKQAQKINDDLKQFKQSIMNECDAIMNRALLEYKVEHEKEKETKGAMTFYSFDKGIKIEINISDQMQFDELINVAQQKINQYIDLKTKDVDGDVRELINDAFKPKRGNLDSKRILSLFRLKIKHHLWQEAMDLIKKSIQVNQSRRYLKVSVRDQEGKYNLIQLNFSSI